MLNNNNKIVILIASSQPSIGKTTFSIKLKSMFDNFKLKTTILSFATIIKESSFSTFSTVSPLFSSSITLEEYKQSKKDIPIKFLNKTPRDLYILYSDFIKSIFGSDVFSLYLKNKIKSSTNSIIIVDDWRLVEDSHNLQEFNLIKIFLTKEDKNTNQLSTVSNLYENKITPEDCDYVFNITSDWSNIDSIALQVFENVVF